MHKSNMAKFAVITLGLTVGSLSVRADANNVWQFTVTSDQNGSDVNCEELVSLPCYITGHATPYILGTLIIAAPLIGYLSDLDSNRNIVVEWDDHHLISFKASRPELVGINFPPPVPTAPLVADIAINEVGNGLSGAITMSYDIIPHPAILVMTGMNNLWTGYWSELGYGIVHQFWARSDKLSSTMVLGAR